MSILGLRRSRPDHPTLDLALRDPACARMIV
jgi:hypothetical protein